MGGTWQRIPGFDEVRAMRRQKGPGKDQGKDQGRKIRVPGHIESEVPVAHVDICDDLLIAGSHDVT